MGCSNVSVPLDGSLELEKPVLMHIPALRYSNKDIPHRLLLCEKLFRISRPIEIKTLEGLLFGNGLHVDRNVFAVPNQMALLDGDNIPIAICERQLEALGPVFHMYTQQQIHSGQTKSALSYNGQTLNKYATVKRRPGSNQLRLTFEGETNPTFIVYRISSGPTRRIVCYKGRSVALIEGADPGDGSANNSEYQLTICPGIDPSLMICLCAISDELFDGHSD